MAHECIVRAERDPFAYTEQWLLGCQCHMGSTYETWRPGDEPIRCPESGADLTQGLSNGEEVGGE